MRLKVGSAFETHDVFDCKAKVCKGFLCNKRPQIKLSILTNYNEKLNNSGIYKSHNKVTQYTFYI